MNDNVSSVCCTVGGGRVAYSVDIRDLAVDGSDDVAGQECGGRLTSHVEDNLQRLQKNHVQSTRDYDSSFYSCLLAAHPSLASSILDLKIHKHVSAAEVTLTRHRKLLSSL